MNNVKKVNIVFLASTLMPYIAITLLDVLGITIINSTQSILFSQIVFALPAIIYLIISRNSLGELLRIKKIKGSNIILLVVFAYTITPFMSFVNAISLIFSKNVINGAIEDITTSNPIYIGVLIVGLLPAILEETVYRGVFYNEYRKINPKIAIVLSALLFGLLHQNLNQFCYAFLLGMIFALLIEATDSILASMIIHLVINTNSVVMTYLIPKVTKVIEGIYGAETMDTSGLIENTIENVDRITMIHMARSMMIPAIVSVILSFILFRTIAKNEGRFDTVKGIFINGDNKEHRKITEFISIPLVIGMGVCIYNIIWNLIS